MLYIIAGFASLAIVVALLMLLDKGKEEKDSSLKTVAVIGLVAFLVLALVLAASH